MKKNSEAYSDAFKEVRLKIVCGPRMQKNIELQNEIHTVINQDPMLVLLSAIILKKWANTGKYSYTWYSGPE